MLGHKICERGGLLGLRSLLRGRQYRARCFGAAETFIEPAPARPHWAILTADGHDRRPGGGTGRVKVTAPDGRTWIEDAKKTDPASWQRKRKYVPWKDGDSRRKGP
jgi:hypothetical protein